MGCLSSFEQSTDEEVTCSWPWIGDLREKRRRKKVNAAARQSKKRSEVAGRRASEVLSKSKMASVSSASAFGEPARPRQRTPASHIQPSPMSPQGLRVSNLPYGSRPATQYVVPRKSVFKYRDKHGTVPRHSVKTTHPSVRRKSIHLVRTRSNNYRVPGEPKSPQTRKSSRVTRFGDFLSQEAFNDQLPPSLRPCSSSKQSFVDIFLPQQAYRSSRRTFARSHTPRSPRDDLLEEIATRSADQIRHGMCGICGTPNSPHTRYGEQGIWLCSACRSPSSVIELPPRITSKASSKQWRQHSTQSADINIYCAENPSEGCSHCHTSLPPVFRDGSLFCSWCCKQLISPSQQPATPQDSTRLTLLRVRRQQSALSVNTQDAEQEWESFDSDISHTPRTMSPPPRSSRERYSKGNGRQRNQPGQPGNEFTPTPPLKDSIYLSRKAYNPARDTYGPPTPPKHPLPPPIPRTKKGHTQHSSTSHHTSLYPSPTPSPPPSPPPRTPHPPTHHQPHPRPHRTSSIYPPTPAPHSHSPFTPSSFPYPPPPIPQDSHIDIRRALRASSIYSVDVTDRVLPVPRVQKDKRGEDYWRLDSPNRDTTFYGFWETILRDV